MTTLHGHISEPLKVGNRTYNPLTMGFFKNGFIKYFEEQGLLDKQASFLLPTPPSKHKVYDLFKNNPFMLSKDWITPNYYPWAMNPPPMNPMNPDTTFNKGWLTALILHKGQYNRDEDIITVTFDDLDTQIRSYNAFVQLGYEIENLDNYETEDGGRYMGIDLVYYKGICGLDDDQIQVME